MRSQPGRIDGLDVLRGVAATAVMLHHHAQYYDVLYTGRQPLSFNLGPGHFGVELFFIISGFVILMTAQSKPTLRAFAISRIARLLPAFLTAVVLASVIFTFWPMPPLIAPTLSQFVANLTMAPELLREKVIDLPYWTLGYELVFYLLIAVAMRFGALPAIEQWGLAWVAVGWLFVAAIEVQLHHRTAIVLLAYYGNYFLIGMCLYRIYSRAAQPVTYVALVFAILANALGGGERTFYTPGYIYLPLAATFALLVWWAATRPARWFVWRPLVFLGRISYPLYLLHVALGFETIRLAIAHGWTTLESVVAAVIVSLAGATTLHYLIEQPGQRWISGVLGQARFRRQAPWPTDLPTPAPQPVSPIKPTMHTWASPRQTKSPDS